MNKTFISKTTRLLTQVKEAHKRWNSLDVRLAKLKRECNHRNPEGVLWVKTKRQAKQGSLPARTYKVCAICGEDVFNDCYGRPVSVWNHLDLPDWRKQEITKLVLEYKRLTPKTRCIPIPPKISSQN